jgi:hypothetical protein
LAEVGQLDDWMLLAPSRCAGWSRLDAVVHVHLGLQEMLRGFVTPTEDQPDTDAASYWDGSGSEQDETADDLDGLLYLHRVSAAYRRPAGAVRHLADTAEAVLGAAERMPPGRVRFQGRVLTTGDFLATWAVELAVHHLDLDLPATAADPAALRLARRTAEALAGEPLPADWSDERAVLVG